MIAVRKPDQVPELVRARIRAGESRPGMLAPSGPELAKELEFAVLMCRKGLNLLLATRELTRVSRGEGAPGAAQAGTARGGRRVERLGLHVHDRAGRTAAAGPGQQPVQGDGRRGRTAPGSSSTRQGTPPRRLALEAGVDIKIVSDQLGDSTTTITRDISPACAARDAPGRRREGRRAAGGGGRGPRRLEIPMTARCSFCVRPGRAGTGAATWSRASIRCIAPQQVRGCFRGNTRRWGGWGSNPRPADYESAALTS